MLPSARRCAPATRREKTYEEVIENIKDVIALCLEDLKAKKQKPPKPAEIIGVQRVEVVV
jgi:predicted RNase H-like HicB family nuclease